MTVHQKQYLARITDQGNIQPSKTHSWVSRHELEREGMTKDRNVEKTWQENMKGGDAAELGKEGGWGRKYIGPFYITKIWIRHCFLCSPTY